MSSDRSPSPPGRVSPQVKQNLPPRTARSPPVNPSRPISYHPVRPRPRPLTANVSQNPSQQLQSPAPLAMSPPDSPSSIDIPFFEPPSYPGPQVPYTLTRESFQPNPPPPLSTSPPHGPLSLSIGAQRNRMVSISPTSTTESSQSIPDPEVSLPTVDNLEDEVKVPVGLCDANNAGDRKAVLQLINRLRDTGVSIDVDLPMIAVIGNQSAGKSSLIESICGVTLPRSSGTCTRCPTECKISQSDLPWKCLVKLHFSTDAMGVPIPVKKVPFGEPITSHSKVEDRIRRAQRAILNPSKDPNKYLLEKKLPEGNEVSFSKNYVSLEISGSGLTDLSFVDLPGLIASVGRGGDDREIELVKSLVASYIERPSCVILLTVACETDFENQGAHRLAREYDPDGKRTIGVLTKPDRIPSGDEPAWVKILRNETEPLVNNWYCVKQPSSQDVARGMSYLEARRRENEWFTSTQPWSKLDAQYQKFLRTSNLTERLSLILSELIKKRLPKIQDELMNAIQETDAKIRALPEDTSDDPISEVLQAIRNFVQDLDQHIQGIPGRSELLQTIRPHQEAFRDAVLRTQPAFVPGVLTAIDDREIQFLDEEDEDHAAEKTVMDGNKISIGDVLRHAEDARTRELPDNYPFVVQLAYIKEITNKWKAPALLLFDKVYEILRILLMKLVNSHFAHMGNGSAKLSVLMIVNDYLDEAAIRTKDKIQWLIDLERNPATFNTRHFIDYKNKFLGEYRTMLEGPAKSNGENRPISGSDEAALSIMASVRAYFEVAYKRFTDIIPMAIDHEAVLGVRRGLDNALQKGLQLTGPNIYDRCKALLAEDTWIVTSRKELRERMDRLQSARRQFVQVV